MILSSPGRFRRTVPKTCPGPVDFGIRKIQNGAISIHYGAIVAVNLSVKNVPETLAAKLRSRAGRNHRSLQGELMAILEAAAGEAAAGRTGSPSVAYEAGAVPGERDSLLDRLTAIAGNRGIDTTTRLTREQAHDRRRLRKSGT